MVNSRQRRYLSRFLGIAAAGSLLSSNARTQSVGYTLIPSAQRVQWNDALAFEDDWMYGGRLALQFGRLVELQPFYFTRTDYPIDAARAIPRFGAAATGRTIDLRHFGTSLQFNLGSGSVVPFVRGSGGILRFEPDSGRRRDRVAVTAGGGLRFGVSGLQAEVFAEQLAFRLNPRDLFGPTTSGAATQRNVVYGAAITVPLSSMPESDETQGLRGTTAPLEPFVGRLRYDSDHGLRNQDVAGIRAGVDFSPLFGIRGFYWRGVNEDRDDTDPVAGYGGEAQFNLNSGPGVSPYVVAGAGRIDYFGSFRDSAGNTRADQTALILGGGVSFRLTDRLRVNAAVRDYIMTPGDSIGTVATTDDLTHSTMLSAGLTISLGGTTGPTERERRRDRALMELREARRERLGQESERREREGGSDERPRDRRRASDTTYAVPDSAARREAGSTAERDSSGRWITVPVPTQGEIILRYGWPPSTDSARREGTRPVPSSDTVARRADTVGAAVPDEVVRALAEMERRLAERIEAMSQPATPAMTPSQPLVVRDTAVDERVRGVPVFQRIGRVSSGDLRPFVGLGGGDGQAQVIASLRADLGPLNPGSGFRFVPEFALGLGGGSTSVLALANLQYPFSSIGGSSSLRPHVTLGAGVFSRSVVAINTAVGLTMDVRRGRGVPLFALFELQGLNLFDHTRLLVGLSSRR